MIEKIIESLEKQELKSDEVVILNIGFKEQPGFIPACQLGQSITAYMDLTSAIYRGKTEVFCNGFDKVLFDSREVRVNCYLLYDNRLPEITGWLIKKGMSEYGFYNFKYIMFSSDKQDCLRLLNEIDNPSMDRLKPASECLAYFIEPMSVNHKIRKRTIFRPEFRPKYQVIEHFAKSDAELIFINRMDE